MFGFRSRLRDVLFGLGFVIIVHQCSLSFFVLEIPLSPAQTKIVAKVLIQILVWSNATAFYERNLSHCVTSKIIGLIGACGVFNSNLRLLWPVDGAYLRVTVKMCRLDLAMPGWRNW